MITYTATVITTTGVIPAKAGIQERLDSPVSSTGQA
jgi:hypothetical protein